MSAPGELHFDRPAAGTLRVRLGGSWKLGGDLPSPDAVLHEIDAGAPVSRVSFESGSVTAWDTGLLTFLRAVAERLRGRGVEADEGGLPEGARRLLDLALAVPPAHDAKSTGEEASWLARLGEGALQLRGSAAEMLGFLGEVTLAFGRLATGRARFRRVDLMLTIQQCGADALPIVTLVTFLVGLILAFVAAVQLRQFGAEIFVADGVALGMAREMGAMMTAIIMAGRTGAAFAAQLGTMTVNQEIDALKTLGIPPIEFLVLPRLLALVLMMPLLSLYAILLGILGGAVVGVGMLDISATQYFEQTRSAVGLDSFVWGLVKAAVYGTLVAVAGCLRGMQCGRSASAVGAAATSAVVTAIVMIVVASGILNLLDNVISGKV